MADIFSELHQLRALHARASWARRDSSRLIWLKLSGEEVLDLIHGRRHLDLGAELAPRETR